MLNSIYRVYIAPLSNSAVLHHHNDCHDHHRHISHITWILSPISSHAIVRVAIMDNPIVTAIQ